MTATYRSSAMGGNASGTSVSATPAGMATGDYMTAALYKENDNAVTVTPSDWVLVQEGDNNDGSKPFHAYLYIRKFTSGDAAPNFSWTGSVWRDLLVTAYSGSTGTGADGSDGSNVTVATGNSTSLSCPAITTSIADTLLVLHGWHWDGGTYTHPAGFTERAGDNRDIGMSTSTATVSPGSQAAQTITLGTSSTRVGVQMGVKSADAGGGAVDKPKTLLTLGVG